MENKSQSPLISEWPEYTLDGIEKVEVDDVTAKTFCNYFFKILHLPEIIGTTFLTFLTSKPI